MKVLLLSHDERNAFLLDRLKQDGDEGALLCRRNTGAWSGLVERVSTPQEAVAWGPDIVIADASGFGSTVKRFRDLGLNVIGSSSFTDRIEDNLMSSLSYVSTVNTNGGVPVADYHEFTDPIEAMEFVFGQKNAWRMVWPDRTSRLFRDSAEVQNYLEQLMQNEGVPPKFALRRDFPPIENRGSGPLRPSYELNLYSQFWIVGFVNSRGVMNPAFAMSIDENLLEEEQGIPTIEGVTLIPIPLENPLVQLTLERVAKSLANLNYTGPVCFGLMAEPGETPREWETQIKCTNFCFTPPPGFWAAFIRGLEMNFGFFLDRMLNPRRPGTPFEWFSGTVTSRRITVPPYPLTEATWITEKQREDLLGMMPKIKLEWASPGVYWNGVRSNGSPGSLEIVHPIVGYLTGRGSNYGDALREIELGSRGIQIQYAQVKCSPGRTFELDMLPVYEAQRQLNPEEVLVDG